MNVYKPEGQWEWFERILSHIDVNDELTFDITHGYRAISIVLTAAIDFLQKAKNISLKAVYYGAFEKNRSCPPIVDMKEFFNISQWAEAVGRLVDDADTRKMAQVAANSPDSQAKELNDETLIHALEDLTNTIRNVDVNNVSSKATAALALIKEKHANASITGKMLLETVLDKFSCLSSAEPMSGKYDKPYFCMQLEIIRLLIEHKLYMQAFTAMREFVGSIGLIRVKKANMETSNGIKQRRKAEIFLRMLCNEEDKWHFSDNDKKQQGRIMPIYDQIKKLGIESTLRIFSIELTEYRNGFDHAWTSKKTPPEDIGEKGSEFYHQLQQVVEKLEQYAIL